MERSRYMRSPYADLAFAADVAATQLIDVLWELSRRDLKLAKSISEALGPGNHCASWIIEPTTALGGMSPVQALAYGRRNDVLEFLGRIKQERVENSRLVAK